MANNRLFNLKRKRDEDQEIQELEGGKIVKKQKDFERFCDRASFFCKDEILFGEDAERAEYDMAEKEKEREYLKSKGKHK